MLAVIVEAIADIGPTFIAAGQGQPARLGPQRAEAARTPGRDTPDFGLLGDFSLLGSWDRVGFVAALLFVFTLLLADFFDTMGTMTAIGAEAGLLDEDGNAAERPADPGRRLDRRGRRWRGVGVEQHVVHRVGVGRR